MSKFYVEFDYDDSGELDNDEESTETDVQTMLEEIIEGTYAVKLSNIKITKLT